MGIINADRSITFENNYIPAVEKNITYGQKLIKVDANILNDFDLNYEFADAVAQPVIRVTVNNVKISPSNWSIVTAVSGKKKLRFTTDLVEGDLLYIEVKTNDRKASATVVYEPTQIWSNNPYNAIHGDITLGQWSKYLASLSNNIDAVTGNTPGSSNLRDLGNFITYDRQFIANESNLHLANYFLSEEGEIGRAHV